MSMMDKKIYDPLFCGTEKAYDIFYCDDVVISSDRLEYVSKAYVVDDGIELADEEIRQDVQLWIVTISLSDWRYDIEPKIGDTVTYVNGKKVSWRISRVIKADDTMRCFCRSR